jgi:Glyoxalase-like domain
MGLSIQLVYACENPARMSEFWAAALEYVVQPPPPGYDTWEEFAVAAGIPEEMWNDYSAVIDPDGVGPRILFERWDGGAPTQRLHLDINAVGGLAVELSDEQRRERLQSERRSLEALGANFHREATGPAGEIWIEMHDPEGNWFCVQ